MPPPCSRHHPAAPVHDEATGPSTIVHRLVSGDGSRRAAAPGDRALRQVGAAVTALVVLALAGCGGGGDQPAGTATVTRVVDGDTVELRIGGQEETARLLGVDTPETVDPDQPVGCYGPEASARTKALLPPGTTVRVSRDVEARDRFGRLLVYLERADDGLFVNEALLAEGYARVLSIAPNDAHRARLSRAAGQARAEGLGLWSACPPEDP